MDKERALAANALRRGAVSFGMILLTAALTATVSNIVTYQMWLTQQDRLQAWNAKPIVDVTIDALAGRKDLSIRNLGRIDIEDVKVFVTVYNLRRGELTVAVIRPGAGSPVRRRLVRCERSQKFRLQVASRGSIFSPISSNLPPCPNGNRVGATI